MLLPLPEPLMQMPPPKMSPLPQFWPPVKVAVTVVEEPSFEVVTVVVLALDVDEEGDEDLDDDDEDLDDDDEDLDDDDEDLDDDDLDDDDLVEVGTLDLDDDDEDLDEDEDLDDDDVDFDDDDDELEEGFDGLVEGAAEQSPSKSLPQMKSRERFAANIG